MRVGNWVQTYLGVLYYPLDPRAEEVEIVDIAQALSKQCRFGGHCKEFYSVAEHCVHVSQIVPPEFALWGLLHDASEAYIVDVPRPLKKNLEGYIEIERRNMAAICKKFGLSYDMPDEVRVADDAMLLAERDQLVGFEVQPWNIPGTPAPVTVECLTPREAFILFMERFSELTE